MSSVRLSRRKRSSIAAGMPIAPAKPGFYGVQKPVQFAPNVTPGTYVAPEDEELDLSALPNEDDDSQALFPPSSEPAPAPSRRRVPPHKRRSLGYIPRPPNAFMLFRAHFVRQRHVPGTIETNHGSLSKIIGNVWNDLPPEERKLWENRAKIEKAAHKAKYPDYRFRPVHNKNKKKQKAAAAAAAASSSHITSTSDNSAETVRCEKISALLMTGKKGEELAAAVAQLDHEQLLQRQQQHQQFFANGGALAQPVPSYPQQQSYLAPPQFPRRPSSVPLPIYAPGFYGFETTQEPGIALPSLNTQFFPISQSSSNSPGPADLSRPMSAVAMPYQHQMQEMQFPAPNSSHADANSFLQPWPMQFNTRMSISNPQMALGLGLRRASSTSAIQNVANNHHVQFGGYARNWEFNYHGNEMPMQSLDGGMGLQRDDEPLPEVNNSLWEPSFALNAATGSGPSPPPTYESYGASPLEKPTHSRSHSQNHMDPIAPHEVLHPVDTTMQYQQHQAMSASASPASSMSLPELDQYSWMTPVNTNGAVAGGEGSAEVAVLAPQPTPLTAAFAALENYEHTQTVDEMWQWQGFAQGEVGHKGDGVPLEALFQNDGSFEIDAYMA